MKLLMYHIVAVLVIQLCVVSIIGADEVPTRPGSSGINQIPQPTLLPANTSTTSAPNSTTTTPTTPTTTTPTTPPTTPTTTHAPNSTTTTSPTTTTLKPTTPTPTTTPTTPPTTVKPTVAPTPKPEPDRKFDGPSFIGGMILTMGLMAIAFVSWKFYKARTERNYHTL